MFNTYTLIEATDTKLIGNKRFKVKKILPLFRMN